MSDSPGPWQLDRKGCHFQTCGGFIATVTKSKLSATPWYRWTIDAGNAQSPDGPLDLGGAGTLEQAKHAATAALIRHAPPPF